MFTLTIFYVCVKDCSGWYYPYPLRGGDEGGLNQPFELHFFLWKYIYIYISIYIWKKNTNRQINQYNSIYIYTHILTDPQKTRETSQRDCMESLDFIRSHEWQWIGHVARPPDIWEPPWHILTHFETSQHILMPLACFLFASARRWTSSLDDWLTCTSYWGILGS